MNILITGGAGFIGSHLTDTLLRSGNRVICVDNFELGTRDNLKEVLKRADFFLAEGTAADADFPVSYTHLGNANACAPFGIENARREAMAAARALHVAMEDVCLLYTSVSERRRRY